MFERSCLRQRRLFTFVRHYSSREVSCGMLTKACRGRINYLKISCFLLKHPLTVWSHIFTGCSQGGKVTFGNSYVPLTRGARENRKRQKHANLFPVYNMAEAEYMVVVRSEILTQTISGIGLVIINGISITFFRIILRLNQQFTTLGGFHVAQLLLF